MGRQVLQAAIAIAIAIAIRDDPIQSSAILFFFFVPCILKLWQRRREGNWEMERKAPTNHTRNQTQIDRSSQFLNFIIYIAIAVSISPFSLSLPLSQIINK